MNIHLRFKWCFSVMVYSLIVAAMTMLTGCRHKDFCWHHPHGEIYIEVEYDDDNDADDIEHLDSQVKATRLLAYHHASGSVELASDIERRTNRLSLEPDTYHFIAYNAGTAGVTFNDRDHFYFHEATTRECDILEPFYDSRVAKSDIELDNGEKVVIPVEPLWSIGAEATECNIGDTIRMTALPLHCRYTYEMRDIEGLEAVSRVSSFITGMSRGANLGSVSLHDTPVTVAVPAKAIVDEKKITGSFMCFGQNPAIDTRHRMGLFIELQSGERYKLLEGDHFDVTEQVTGAPNRRRVHIIIDGVKIPTPDSGVGTGFEVELNPWTPGEDLDLEYHF